MGRLGDWEDGAEAISTILEKWNEDKLSSGLGGAVGDSF